jgi:GNAT superfamily N-acetyltransferase
MPVIVRKVESQQDLKTFFAFPWHHYRDNPHWIPELPTMRWNSLDKTKHAAWEYMTGEYFIAWQGDQAVGTIAAFVNHRHNEFHNENIGFFGFFECIDDQDAAAALFQAAEDYLRTQGVSAIRGPANFTSNEAYGLLVDGFDLDPVILMPYNPQYYIRLIENTGYEKAMELLSWRNDFKDAAANMKKEERLMGVMRKNAERRQITTRILDNKNKKRDFQIIRSIYESAWEKNWGFVPMTDRELDNMVKDLGFLVMPEYTIFAYVGDQPAGFLLCAPNFNEAIKHVHPRPGLPEPWWLLKTLWHWKIRPKITSMRVLLLGVKEEFRGIGVDATMFLALAEQMVRETRFEWADESWVLETNEDLNRLLERFGARIHRRHRIYQKSL